MSGSNESSYPSTGEGELDPLSKRLGEILDSVDTWVGLDETLSSVMTRVDPLCKSIESWIFGPQPGFKGAWNSHTNSYVITFSEQSNNIVDMGTIPGNVTDEQFEELLRVVTTRGRELLKERGYGTVPKADVPAAVKVLKARKAWVVSVMKRQEARDMGKGPEKLD
jgi:hypothetical protein